jgi:hypothetical protein
MRRSTAFLTIITLGWLFAPIPVAWAQSANFSVVLGAPVETVIVTAPKWLGDSPQTVIHGFVNSYVLAAPVSGEITRWKNGICPKTRGLSQEEYNAYVTERIREVAGYVGAPQQTSSCHDNIDVIFTDKPQDFLDQIRKEGGARLLGPLPSHAETVGTMRYAIQAWYATATRDTNGALIGDDEDGDGLFGLSVRDMPRRVVEGSLLRTDLRSELAHIYIIADTGQTQVYSLGAIADYVAVLALSQTQSFEDCKSIPSITNLISPSCGADLKPTAITDTDMAFLKGVYAMDPGASLLEQKTFISDQIAKSLGIK